MFSQVQKNIFHENRPLKQFFSVWNKNYFTFVERLYIYMAVFPNLSIFIDPWVKPEKEDYAMLFFFQNTFIPGFVVLKLHKMMKTCMFILISNSDIDNFVSKWTALYNCNMLNWLLFGFQ